MAAILGQEFISAHGCSRKIILVSKHTFLWPRNRFPNRFNSSKANIFLKPAYFQNGRYFRSKNLSQLMDAVER
jgi:hypothetical protein